MCKWFGDFVGHQMLNLVGVGRLNTFFQTQTLLSLIYGSGTKTTTIISFLLFRSS